MDNIFNTDNGQDEIFCDLLKTDKLRIEKIVSHGNISPPDFWYDQTENEWVALLLGAATIEYDNGAKFELNNGDFMNIPARQKHRIASCSDPAIWLAVFY